MEPFSEDQIVRDAAERIGLDDIVRRPTIESADLPESYRCPRCHAVKWAEVNRAIREGHLRATGLYEYILRRRRDPQPAAQLATSSAVEQTAIYRKENYLSERLKT